MITQMTAWDDQHATITYDPVRGLWTGFVNKVGRTHRVCYFRIDRVIQINRATPPARVPWENMDAFVRAVLPTLIVDNFGTYEGKQRHARRRFNMHFSRTLRRKDMAVFLFTDAHPHIAGFIVQGEAERWAYESAPPPPQDPERYKIRISDGPQRIADNEPTMVSGPE